MDVGKGVDVALATKLLSRWIPFQRIVRHPPLGDTNGWYIWGGQEMSESPDFFQPLHTEHLATRLPQVLKFLGLPPGYRFLLAGDYIDVWYDDNLLNASVL